MYPKTVLPLASDFISEVVQVVPEPSRFTLSFITVAFVTVTIAVRLHVGSENPPDGTKGEADGEIEGEMLTLGLWEGEADGLKEGDADGLSEGEAEGEADGDADGLEDTEGEERVYVPCRISSISVLVRASPKITTSSS